MRNSVPPRGVRRAPLKLALLRRDCHDAVSFIVAGRCARSALTRHSDHESLRSYGHGRAGLHVNVARDPWSDSVVRGRNTARVRTDCDTAEPALLELAAVERRECDGSARNTHDHEREGFALGDPRARVGGEAQVHVVGAGGLFGLEGAAGIDNRQVALGWRSECCRVEGPVILDQGDLPFWICARPGAAVLGIVRRSSRRRPRLVDILSLTTEDQDASAWGSDVARGEGESLVQGFRQMLDSRARMPYLPLGLEPPTPFRRLSNAEAQPSACRRPHQESHSGWRSLWNLARAATTFVFLITSCTTRDASREPHDATHADTKPACPSSQPRTGYACSKVWSRTLEQRGYAGGEVVAVDASGNIAVLAETRAAFAVSDRDLWVGKYDANGVELWSKTLETTGRSEARAIAIHGDATVVISGLVAGKSWIRKFDSKGNDLWTRTGDSGIGHSIAIEPNGNISISVRGVGARKYDPGGDLLWTRFSEGLKTTFPPSIAVDDEGNVFVLDTVHTGDGGPVADTDTPEDVWLRKFDGSGEELWTRVYDGGRADRALRVAADRVGNVFTTAASWGELRDTPGAGWRVRLRRYSDRGDDVWTITEDRGGNHALPGTDGEVLWIGWPDLWRVNDRGTVVSKGACRDGESGRLFDTIAAAAALGGGRVAMLSRVIRDTPETFTAPLITLTIALYLIC